MSTRPIGILALLLLAACGESREPMGPAGATPRLAVSAANPGVFRATVRAPGGAPAAGFVVTVVNRAQGPYAIEGNASSYTGAVTASNGTVTISGLPVPGEYCVLARPLSSLGTATSFGSFIAPLQSPSPAPTPTADAAGGIWVGSGGRTVPLTPANFQSYCYEGSAQPAALVLTAAAPFSDGLLRLQPAGSLRVRFLDLNGQPTSSAAWALQGILPPPWMQDFPLPAGVRPGILLSAAPANGAGLVTLQGILAGPLTVESEILNLPGQGQLTFTLNLNATGDDQLLPPLMLEPLLCVLNKHAEATGDATGAVDFRAPVKDGFRADFGPPLTRRNELGLIYGQTAGDATLDLRLWLGNADYHVLARYRYANGQGSITQLSGSGLALGVQATPFFAPQPGGAVQVSWSITGLPGALTAVDYNLSAAGDQFPELVNGRKAFQPVAIPSTCTGGQSNDDQWWLN